LAQVGELRRQAAVDTKHFLVNNGRHRHAVEHVVEELPQLHVVRQLALVVEAVDAVDGGALVVAPQQEEILGVFDFVTQQQQDALQALLAAVDVVAEEEVVGLSLFCFGWGRVRGCGRG